MLSTIILDLHNATTTNLRVAWFVLGN